MWGAAPRLGRLAPLLALVAVALLACVQGGGPASAAVTLTGGGSKRFDGLGLAGDVPIQKRPALLAPGTPPANTALPTISGAAQVGHSGAIGRRS